MLKIIIEKELRDIIGSKKFSLTFAVCAVLILLTFYISAQNHQRNLARYEAAKAENLRQMEGITDWLMVKNHRIFLPPQPLEALVTGVSNDIGRTIPIEGRGELVATDSRFGDDPLFAVFRFLDLTFLFQIVLSLFAILFGFNAINGEKELGTLRLTFANSLMKDKFILGKLIGSFLALAIPLLIPFLLGGLLLPLWGIHLNLMEWLKLGMIIFTGFLFFGVFLNLAILSSTVTTRSANSFLFMLIIWILMIFIVPRATVLIAGRAVSVPSVDELNYQKSKYRTQLWEEDREKISEFKPAQNNDPQLMVQDFNKFMQKLADDREIKINEFNRRLNETRENKQLARETLALSLARISPAALLTLAATNLAGTASQQKNHFATEAAAYQKQFSQFMVEKTGLNIGGRVMVFKMKQEGNEEEEKPIDSRELPIFHYQSPALGQTFNQAIPDMGILLIFNLLFFVGAVVTFLKFDIR